jgi:predicted DNA-binding antitoxin AbrB/MazE fold protein
MKTVEAVVENGVLKLLDDVTLREGAVVQVLVADRYVGTDIKQHKTPAEIMAEIAELPLENESAFSGEDHDEVLYGWKKSK